MQGIDSEQPLESPPVSVQMPGSPINKFDGSLSGDDASFVVKPDSPKVNDLCSYLQSYSILTLTKMKFMDSWPLNILAGEKWIFVRWEQTSSYGKRERRAYA